MKSLVIIFVILIVGIIFISFNNFTSLKSIDDTNYNEIPWRLPVEKDIIRVQNSFLQSEIEICSSYYIKKFEGEKYLVACEMDNGSWAYYTVYSRQKKVYDFSPDLVASFNPPQNLQKKSGNELVGKSPKSAEKSQSPDNTPTLEAK